MIPNLFAMIGGFASKLIAPFIAYMKGRSDVENDNLKEENKRLRNRPRTSSDINKLFARIIKKSKDRE